MGLFTQSSTLLSLSKDIISFINLLVAVLIPLALVVFFIGLVRYIYKAGDVSAHKEARESIMWSLIALFVLISVWGILQLMSAAFFPGGAPTNYIGPGVY
jgi:Type IV secretion system pilin